MNFFHFAATFLSAAAVVSANSSAPLDPSLEPGRATFEHHCAACHGVNGDGKGAASVWLFPRPRNFSAGFFKIKSTPGVALPTDDDLFRTVTRGMPGSSMPSFTYLTEQQRREVVQYVKYLTAYTDKSGQRINRFDAAAKAGLLAKSITVPPEPAVTVATMASGQALYTKMGCMMCHGETGAGDGPTAPTLKDTEGFYLPPRDFNNGAFRGGHEGADLYTRIVTGIPGTPMPPFDDTLIKPEDRWSLVHYVQSLRRKDVEINDILDPVDQVIHVAKVKKLLTDPMDPGWENRDPVRVRLNPIWPEPDPIPAVAITAVHDGKRLAILCQWRDAIVNGAPVRVQDFQDAVALQFSMNGSTPFLGMGDAKNPVNIWKWNAGWQEEVDDHRPDMRDLYASMHVDFYFNTNTLYRTAEAAGNVLSQPHKSPVEDANAHGFGTFTSQPMEEQNVQGKGIWHDGFWNVVFLRELKSKNADDVKFAPEKTVPVAFAVWNGQQRDRNGRKVISNWYKLILNAEQQTSVQPTP
jgi:mono/diheme cytochrome c family protein